MKSTHKLQKKLWARRNIILFKETGAAAFFKEPLHELFEESVSLDNFIARETVTAIEEQLAASENNNHRVAVVEAFLLKKISNYNTDKLVLSAVQKIYSAKGALKIKELADKLYISQDAFEKRFRKTVGTSPKQFSSIVRMRSIVDQNKHNKILTDIAFDAGYFDQPHFNKDFKLFTGQTPSDFFKSPSFW